MSTSVIESYIGQVKEVGGKELSKDGTKEKPRKVVVSDSPDYKGKTFRCWPDSDAFQTLRDALDSGDTVRITYEIRDIPGTDYKQNLVQEVLVEGGGESRTEPVRGRSNTGDDLDSPAPLDWTPPEEPPEDYGPPPDLWAQTKQQLQGSDKQVDWDEKTAQIEAGWAIKCVLQTDPGIDTDGLISRSLELIQIKYRVARELRK